MSAIVGLYRKHGPVPNGGEQILRTLVSRGVAAPSDRVRYYLSVDNRFSFAAAGGDAIEPEPARPPAPGPRKDGFVVRHWGRLWTIDDRPVRADDRPIIEDMLVRAARSADFTPLSTIEGMWGWVVYDPSRHELTLARSPVTGDDVFTVENKDTFWFSNVIECLLPIAQDLSLNPAAAVSSIRFGTPGPGQTLIAGISRLESGVAYRLRDSDPPQQFLYHAYFDPAWFSFFERNPSDDCVLDAIEQELIASTRCLVSEVDDLLVTVSGGLDSALVAHAIKRVVGRPFLATYGHIDGRILGRKGELSERESSEVVAARTGAEHLCVNLRDFTSEAEVRKVASTAFAGFTYPPLLHLRALARVAEAHDKSVLMMGLMGDGTCEVPRFERISTARLNGRPMGALWPALQAVSRTRAGRGVIARVLRRPDWIVPAYDLFETPAELFTPAYLVRYFPKNLVRGTSALLRAGPDYENALPSRTATQVLALARQRRRVPDLWVGTMRHALSGTRVNWADPFATCRFLRMSMALPPWFRRRDDTSKYIFRKLVARAISPEVARRSKYGFSSVNVYALFSRQLKMEQTILDSEIFDDPQLAGGRRAVRENKKFLWPFFCFALTRGALRAIRPIRLE